MTETCYVLSDYFFDLNIIFIRSSRLLLIGIGSLIAPTALFGSLTSMRFEAVVFPSFQTFWQNSSF